MLADTFAPPTPLYIAWGVLSPDNDCGGEAVVPPTAPTGPELGRAELVSVSVSLPSAQLMATVWMLRRVGGKFDWWVTAGN